MGRLLLFGITHPPTCVEEQGGHTLLGDLSPFLHTSYAPRRGKPQQTSTC